MVELFINAYKYILQSAEYNFELENMDSNVKPTYKITHPDKLAQPKQGLVHISISISSFPAQTCQFISIDPWTLFPNDFYL